MTINVPKTLKEAASLFPPNKPLYVVGGYVRDSLLGLEAHDIDVCSALTVEELNSVFRGTKFRVLPVNLRVGTTIISASGLKAEYTTFRKDSYPKDSGAHAPAFVSFTDDIEVDARRRDFKCNAIYYDIANDKIVDVLGGVDDLDRKIISTADKPEKVFSEDGLRILRLARIAAEFGFEIETATFAAAKELVERLKDISVERITAEFNRILVADCAHPTLEVKDGHIRGVRLLDKLGALDIILPELCAMRGLEQNAKWHRFDAYEHSLHCFEYSAPSVRLAALLHDVGKLPCLLRQGNMHGHSVDSERLTKIIMSRMKYPRAETERVSRLVANHMYNMNGDTSVQKIRLFIARNRDIIEDEFLLQRADCEASNGEEPIHTKKLEEIYAEMLSDGTPFSVKDLKVNGDDLIAYSVPNEQRSETLNELWELSVTDGNLRTREAQLRYLSRRKK